MTGNQIGDEGAKAISELLKTNTSLNDLNVGSLEENENKSRKKRQETHMEMELDRLWDWRRRKEISENGMG